MGLFSGVKKAFKKVFHKVTGRGNSGQSAPKAPTPAPEIDLNQKDEGEAEEKKETAKIRARKGKKALKISKNEAPATGVGRNIV